ncbi:hypothetical protein L227DRAFT_605910 [Lentinus tigrinus ALCF2SS1-6]|uniref:Uncharacterized protein n=1 Tax=Lentinus tigrinus ALCF2SS1-6 TaxID=1328759 RepID=A0A5C2SVW9_9APHY|nr:hypothetical protein L227DRAFT_605910 [Lentinus tigrinus ALCF2SS1-6]
MSNLLLIDDNDPVVQFSSGWDTNHTGVAQAVNQSMHCTTQANSSVSVPFNGVGIEVMTVIFPRSQGGSPILSFAVDGKTVASSAQSLRATEVHPFYNDSSFKGVGLSPGAHVLNITSHRDGTNLNTFCLDYFLIESQPSGSFDIGGMTLTGAPTPTGKGGSSSASRIAPVGGSLGGTVGLILVTVIAFLRCEIPSESLLLPPSTSGVRMVSPLFIDDTDPMIKYSSGWVYEAGFAPAVNATRHGAALAGQTVELAFNGTRIDIVTTLDPSSVGGQPTTNYSIDGVFVASQVAPFAWQEGRPHVLTITNVNGTKPNMFWLDYFLVYDFLPPAQQDSSSSASWSDSDKRQTLIPWTAPGSASSTAEPRAFLLPVDSPLSSRPGSHGRYSMPDPKLRPDHPAELATPSSPTATATAATSTVTSPSEMLRAEVARSPWYVPPERQWDAQSLLRGMAARRTKQQRRRPLPPRPSIDGVEEKDSGLRLYSDDTLPPRYTAE